MLKVYLLQVTCSLLLLFIPGLAVSWVLRIKGIIAWAFAPLISLSISALGAVIANLVGIRWGIGSFLLMAAVFLTMAFPLSRKFQPLQISSPPPWLLPTGIAACLLQIIPFFFASSIHNPIQQVDSTFHMNLVWNILDSGNGSTFGGATRMYGLETTRTIYPSGWHDFLSLFTTKDTVATGVNAVHVMICVLWVLGITILAHCLFPDRPEIVLLAQGCSALVNEFPTYMQTVYPIFPNSLAVACLPVAGAAFFCILCPPNQVNRYQRVFFLGILVCLVLSICLVHPSFIFNSVLLGIGPLLYLLWYRIRQIPPDASRRILLIATSMVLALLTLVVVVATSSSYVRTTFSRMAKAYNTSPRVSLLSFVKILSLASWYPTDVAASASRSQNLLAFACMILTIFGIFFARKFGRSAIALIWACIPLALVALGTMWRIFPLTIIAGFWYMSPHRVLAALAVPQIMVMAVGATAIFSKLSMVIGTHSKWSPHRINRVVTVVSSLAFAVTIPLGIISKSTYYRIVYDPNSSFPTIVASPAELSMLERLRESHLDKGMILGDPMNGSALAQAVSGKEVVLPQMYYRDENEDENYLKDNFAKIGNDSKVCSILQKYRITYFYYDSDRFDVTADVNQKAPGFYQGINWSSLRKIDSGGTASLYEITGCR